MKKSNENISEKALEMQLVRFVESMGGRAVKFIPTYENGFPDRIVILPKGITWYVEMKRPKGGVIAPLQEIWHDKLFKLGHRLYIIQTIQELELFKKGIRDALA